MLPFAATWMDLENIMLHDRSQTEKRQILYDITHMQNLKKNKNECLCKTQADLQM